MARPNLSTGSGKWAKRGGEAKEYFAKKYGNKGKGKGGGGSSSSARPSR